MSHLHRKALACLVISASALTLSVKAEDPEEYNKFRFGGYELLRE